jgi:hypothetical protein
MMQLQLQPRHQHFALTGKESYFTGGIGDFIVNVNDLERWR